MGLEWARRNGCGFMETSARNTVNIEETFALIVRRVVEARRLAAGNAKGAGAREKMAVDTGAAGAAEEFGSRRAMTAPLSPLPGGPEKDMVDGGIREKRRGGWKAFWARFVCWR